MQALSLSCASQICSYPFPITWTSYDSFLSTRLVGYNIYTIIAIFILLDSIIIVLWTASRNNALISNLLLYFSLSLLYISNFFLSKHFVVCFTHVHQNILLLPHLPTTSHRQVYIVLFICVILITQSFVSK